MSTAKKTLKKQAALHAITRGQEPVRKLPEVIELARSQSLSLVALQNDETRLRKQAQDLNAALEATIKARVEVLNEVAAVHNVTLEEISASYQFDGEKLILAVSLRKEPQ